MHSQVTISLLHALQLGGLLPCLFMVLLLIVLAKDPVRIIVPIGFFLALSSSFIWPVLTLQGVYDHDHVVIFLQTLQPCFGFLLLMQFLTGRIPSAVYWLILALPIVGGSSIVYSTLMTDELCIFGEYCMTSLSIRILYNVFAASLIFLLLLVQFTRKRFVIGSDDTLRQHKYWLVMAFIGLYMVLLSLDLAMLSENITIQEHDLTTTVIRISFIYLVLTSLFRVFDQSRPFGVGTQTQSYRDRPVKDEVIEQINQAMTEKQLYREMGFNREMLAKHLEVGEHVISKAVNKHFGKNFNEFVNSYRVEEAKKRLVEEATAVTAIAFEVGFSSIASFNRVFKGLVGCSPTEYRVKHQAAK